MALATPSAVVMGVDAHRDAQLLDHRADDVPHLARQRSPVGVAQDQKVGATFLRGVQRRQGVIGDRPCNRRRNARRRR